jgi:cytochrome bd-type quinol oxidase subunit 2
MENIWYLVAIAGAGLVALTMQGAWWFALKTAGEQQARAKRIARNAWWGAAAFTVLVAGMSFRIHPNLWAAFTDDPRRDLAATLALAGLIGVKLWDRKETELLTFFACAGYIFGMVMSAA